MSAGTLTLTNGSAVATGAGTAFTTELAAGDFVVATIGGIPYTLPVKTVDSATQLTLVSNFTGPTQAGAAWYAVPRVAMNLVTAAVVTQAAEALRGLNYDKQNWQQVFSGTATITVRLPDGSTYTGPAWGGISTTLSGISTTLSDKADKASLGTAAGKDVGLTADDVMQPGMFGIGLKSGARAFNTTNFADIQAGMLGKGAAVFRNNNILASDPSIYQYSPSLWIGAGDTWASVSFPYEPRGQVAIASGSESAGRGGVRLLWCNVSTTVDSGGFIKKASPIVKIFATGRAENNDESEGTTVERQGVGSYLITGCMGLNSDAAWGGIDGGFEIPVDRNKQPRIWLDYEVNADGSILVKTFHRTHLRAPGFARNEVDGLVDGDPVDIPADAFVSVRVEMPVDSIWNQRQREAEEAMKRAQDQASE